MQVSKKFVTFVIVSISLLALLTGYGFLRLENQNNGIEAQHVLIVKQQKELSRITDAVAKSAENQLANGVSNVSIWCNAINETREEARKRAILAKKTINSNFPPYKVKNLNCSALEQKTANSGRSK